MNEQSKELVSQLRYHASCYKPGSPMERAADLIEHLERRREELREALSECVQRLDPMKDGPLMYQVSDALSRCATEQEAKP